ncbi:MAG TPA: S1 RNA-binding domain-containing protein, partial [Cellvibrionaceae bacterium]|nr:S1 RNA-binding domain-containing protein [Cellvibrionaceae bacterium]
RDVVGWLKCEYLQSRVGEVFPGIVGAVVGFGLFVELSDLFVEGLVHISSLPQDYYHHQPAQHRLVGERTGRVFRLGDRLTVRVVRVSLDERKVDFELVEHLGKSVPNAKFNRDKKSAKRTAFVPHEHPAKKQQPVYAEQLAKSGGKKKKKQKLSKAERGAKGKSQDFSAATKVEPINQAANKASIKGGIAGATKPVNTSAATIRKRAATAAPIETANTKTPGKVAAAQLNSSVKAPNKSNEQERVTSKVGSAAQAVAPLASAKKTSRKEKPKSSAKNSATSAQQAVAPVINAEKAKAKVKVAAPVTSAAKAKQKPSSATAAKATKKTAAGTAKKAAAAVKPAANKKALAAKKPARAEKPTITPKAGANKIAAADKKSPANKKAKAGAKLAVTKKSPAAATGKNSAPTKSVGTKKTALAKATAAKSGGATAKAGQSKPKPAVKTSKTSPKAAAVKKPALKVKNKVSASKTKK